MGFEGERKPKDKMTLCITLKYIHLHTPKHLHGLCKCKYVYIHGNRVSVNDKYTYMRFTHHIYDY